MQTPRENHIPQPAHQDSERELHTLIQILKLTSRMQADWSGLSAHLKTLLPVQALTIASYEGSTGLMCWRYDETQKATPPSSRAFRPEDDFRHVIAQREMRCRPADHGSRVLAPLITAGRVVGLVEIASSLAAPWPAREMEVLSGLCAHLAVLLDNERMSSQCAEFADIHLKLEGEQLKTQKLQSIVDFARSIAHELTQPLTGIGGYCALIKEDADPGHEILRDIDEIQKQALRLEELVLRFQNISHIEYVEPERDQA